MFPAVAVVDIYARISSDRTGGGLGVTRQTADCAAELERRGHIIGVIHVDNDLSAYRSKRRPGYQALLDRLKAGETQGFCVWHLDRLTRTPRELEDVIEVIEATGAQVLTVTGGDYDLTTTDGRAMARVVGVFARKESEDKARRTRRKHLELANDGRPVGGTRHFGYLPLYGPDGRPHAVDDDGHPTLAIEPAEAELVRHAVDAVLAGTSLRSICTDWNARGLTGTRGGRFTTGMLRRVVTSPTIAGWRSLDRQPIAEGTWPAIVDLDTVRRVEAILTTRANELGGGFRGAKPRTYLLTGLLHCGLCGVKLIARAHGPRKPSYVCTTDPSKGGCGKIRVIAGPLEDEIRDRVFAVIEDGRLARHLPERSDPSAPLLADLTRLEADQEQLARDYYAERRIDRAQFFAASDALAGRIASTKKQVATAARSDAVTHDLGDVDDLRAKWATFDLERQRTTIEGVVERIDIARAPVSRGRFDPARVTVVWRT